MKQHSPATTGMTWLVERNFAVLEKYGILESLNVKVRMLQLFWIKGIPWEMFLLHWLVTAWINSFLVFPSRPLPFSVLRTVLIIKHKPINVSSRKKKIVVEVEGKLIFMQKSRLTQTVLPGNVILTASNQYAFAITCRRHLSCGSSKISSCGTSLN